MTKPAKDWARYQKKIRNVIEYIHANSERSLTSEVLADVAHLSVYHWHRIYRSVAGETAAATVKRCRMQKAAAELLRTTKTVATVGASIGIADVHSFTRTFKDYYGVAPGKFRDAHQQLPVELDTSVRSDFLTLDGGDMPVVEVVDMPDTQSIGVWHKGDYMQIGQSFDKVLALIGMHKLLPAPLQVMGVYHGDPEVVPMEEQRSFAGVVVGDSLIPASDLEAGDLESYVYTAGRFAVLVHKGPYVLLSQSYNWLYGTWLPASGETIRDCPCCEKYLNSPIGTDPNELLTAIYLPLE